MNLFFRAFTQQELDDMVEDHGLIDAWIEQEKYTLEADVETAWDVLAAILDGAGVMAGEPVDDAMFNGCSLISADEVKEHAQILSEWTHEQLLQGLEGLDDEADLYHLEVFQDAPDYLLEQFDCMLAFYKEAAEKDLAVVSYAA